MIRTGYSFKTAVGHPPQVIERLKEIGWTTAPIADRCSTFGYVRWTKLAEKAGLRPVYGVELAVTPELGLKKPPLDYWTFMARDDLKPLHELIWLATSNPGKEPSLTYQQALRFPGLKISGPATILSKIGPEPGLFVGLSPASPRGLIKQALREGFDLCAIPNNYYPREQDHELYRVMLGGRAASSQTYAMHIQDEGEFRASLAWLDSSQVGQAITNRETVLATSVARLARAEILHPDKPCSLRELCEQGAAKLGCDLSDPTYAARLEKELALIAEKEFEDYFFIIADMMQFARRHMVVGPARGSSCGSLVCYLLGITAIDPIPFKLIFERFIDRTRADLPDIDLDFSDAKRHLVFEYLDEKYGRERSARLGSVNMIKAKAALNMIGTSLRIPSGRVGEVSKTVIKRSFGDSRADSTIEDTFKDTETGQRFISDYPEAMIVTRMEWHPNNAAQHAAGVVLTEHPVLDYVAVDARTGATMCDKKDAEELNLLKIDALGLTQLSILERTMELIGVEPRSEWLEALPIDDQKAYDVLNEQRFSGIFQFGMGTASAKLVTELVTTHGGRINDFEDIVNLTAIVRPGPLGSGAAAEWIRRRAGKSPINIPHPSMEPFMRDTRGIVIYQEQVMHIGREIGGLTWDDVTALRKAMSKSLGKEYFDQFGDRWKAGAINNHGVPADVAEKIWDDLCAYGMWAFNRSHSVAYGMISYWCLWLKAHHPLEFAAATLDKQADPDMQIQTLRELVAEGIEYVPVDVRHSTDRWVVADGRLVGPLTNVKGIGPKSVQDIIACRAKGLPFKPGVAKKLADPRTPLDTLSPIEERAKRLIEEQDLNIVSAPRPVHDIEADGVEQQVMIIAKVTKIAPLDENEPSRVAKRGGKVLNGPTSSVNLFVRDDTGEIFCKVGRWDFERLGRQFIEKAKAGKSIFAIKGRVPGDFRMIAVQDVRYIGEIEQ